MGTKPEDDDVRSDLARRTGRAVRAAIYGTGSWANQTHIPNLKKLGVDVVAACDVDAAALGCTAKRFDIPAVYTDGREMVEKERFDVLYSVVPAFARMDVEIRAVERGIHLFSEKPQALRMAVALDIDRAVRNAGVLSTVCFRERYRPLFQEARRILSGKRIVHAIFSIRGRSAAAQVADGRCLLVAPDGQIGWVGARLGCTCHGLHQIRDRIGSGQSPGVLL